MEPRSIDTLIDELQKLESLVSLCKGSNEWKKTVWMLIERIMVHSRSPDGEMFKMSLDDLIKNLEQFPVIEERRLDAWIRVSNAIELWKDPLLFNKVSVPELENKTPSPARRRRKRDALLHPRRGV